MHGALHHLLSLLILAAQPAAPIESRQPDAVEVFHCGFEASADEDYDGWPDRWQRRRGPEYPGYLPVQIVETPSPEGASCLQLSVNGGGVAISSPKIEIGSLFSYVLEGYVRSEGILRDDVYLTISFLDGQGKTVGTFESQRFHTVKEWTKVRLGPLSATSDKVQSAVIELRVEPRGVADLKGTVWFDDLWLGRLPRISMSTNSPCNVYSSDAPPPEITCKVSGILERDPEMTFELIDCSNQSADRQQRVQGQVVAHKTSQASTLLGTTITRNVGFAGTARWQPQIKEPGYYRVRVAMSSKAGLILERQTSLVVLPTQVPAAHGEFGWSLPDGEDPLSLAALGQLLPQAGIHWVKFPVWSGGSETERLDQLVSFAERLGRRGIELVGLLDKAPAEIQPQLGETAGLSAADIFSSSPKIWYPSLEPIMTRLALQVKWWQLGNDEDFSFVGYPDLQRRIGDVKKLLGRFGQKIFLGFSWPVLQESPEETKPAWDFLCYRAIPALTEDETMTYLAAHGTSPAKRWLSIQPLPRGEYSIETRAADLIRRMVAARMAGANAVFIARPFDNDSGLMNADGTPSDLFLPWRTAAAALSGAQHLGSLRLGRTAAPITYSPAATKS